MPFITPEIARKMLSTHTNGNSLWIVFTNKVLSTGYYKCSAACFKIRIDSVLNIQSSCHFFSEKTSILKNKSCSQHYLSKTKVHPNVYRT